MNNATFEVMLASVRLYGVMSWLDPVPPKAIDDLLLACAELVRSAEELSAFTKSLRTTL